MTDGTSLVGWTVGVPLVAAVAYFLLRPQEALPPPPVCDEGEERVASCGGGVSVVTAHCAENAWVPTGETCYSVCDCYGREGEEIVQDCPYGWIVSHVCDGCHFQRTDQECLVDCQPGEIEMLYCSADGITVVTAECGSDQKWDYTGATCSCDQVVTNEITHSIFA